MYLKWEERRLFWSYPLFIALYIHSRLLFYKEVHIISLRQGFHFLPETATRPSFSADSWGEGKKKKDTNILIT